ncbi:MAG: hypothetical protein M3198_07915 [Actinomycetota bacterium]|nr:hypothetical protein [Actinomycetota bacterium]
MQYSADRPDRRSSRTAQTSRWIFRYAALLLAVMTMSCEGRQGMPQLQGAGDHPYAGLEQREVKALSAERTAELLDGRGMGYALAAELNHYPGPLHVLELAHDLQLSSRQEEDVRRTMNAMRKEALRLGRELIDREAELDLAFRSERIDADRVARLTGEIAAVEGRLRAAHLQAHLETKKLLTPQQVAHYDHLRGYTAAQLEDGGHGHDSHQ